MTQDRAKYQNPEMEIMVLFENEVYTDIIQGSTVPSIDDPNYGSDYGQMFG